MRLNEIRIETKTMEPGRPHDWVWRIAGREFPISESEPATEYGDGADGSRKTIGYHALRIKGLSLAPGLSYELMLADRATGGEVRVFASCGDSGLLYKFTGVGPIRDENTFWKVYNSL